MQYIYVQQPKLIFWAALFLCISAVQGQVQLINNPGLNCISAPCDPAYYEGQFMAKTGWDDIGTADYSVATTPYEDCSTGIGGGWHPEGLIPILTSPLVAGQTYTIAVGWAPRSGINHCNRTSPGISSIVLGAGGAFDSGTGLYTFDQLLRTRSIDLGQCTTVPYGWNPEAAVAQFTPTANIATNDLRIRSGLLLPDNTLQVSLSPLGAAVADHSYSSVWFLYIFEGDQNVAIPGSSIDLAPGETAIMLPATPGTYTSADPSIASVSPSGIITAVGDGTTTISNTCGNTVNVNVGATQVDLETSVSPISAVDEAGAFQTFDFTLNNNGPADATGVKTRVQIPGNRTFVSSTPSQGSYDPNTEIWDVGAVANGTTATLSLTIRVN